MAAPQRRAIRSTVRFPSIDTPLGQVAVTIRLLIADDHELVRDGLRLTFEGTDIEIAAEAANGQQAFDALDESPIDVALIDINMPGADGYHFLRLVQGSGANVPVLMHSVYDGAEYIRRCRALGAKGFIVKGREGRELLAAIRAIHAGEEFWEVP